MGVASDEILAVSQLVGQKTFFNEFVAYDALSRMIGLRESGEPRCNEQGQIQVCTFRLIAKVYFFSGSHNAQSTWPHMLCVVFQILRQLAS